jgi:uncharacterized protein (DUF1015 family)
MADVRGFRGIHYDTEKIHNADEVISPPYDVISPEQKAGYLRNSPYNVVRLILPEGENPYRNAAETFHTWIEQGILVQDLDPAVYSYHQTYTTPEGDQKTRKGFLARIRLEDFSRGIVLPHEATLFAPKEDRLNLLRACRANFSPIFSLYSDPEQQIDTLLRPFTEQRPLIHAEDAGGWINKLWRISDPETVQQVGEMMKSRWVLIADGHHRYESCLVYRDEMMREDNDSEAPFHFTLMFFCNLEQPGLTVLPYNRGVLHLPEFRPESVLKKARHFFEIHEFEDQEMAEMALKREGKTHIAFLGLLLGDRNPHLFRLKTDVKLRGFYPENTPEAVQRLDVNVLHRIFLEQVLRISAQDVIEQKYLKYYKDPKEEMKDFLAGRLQIAFFLNPTRVSQVVEVSQTGYKMPQKSTFFYPKVMTGLVINKH